MIIMMIIVITIKSLGIAKINEMEKERKDCIRERN